MACMDDTLAAFYDIQLATGQFIRQDGGNNQVMLNESAVRAMGVTNPVGMVITYSQEQKEKATVVGVVRDFHITAPTIPVQPTLYVNRFGWMDGNHVLIKYHEGSWPIG